jgi:hypothetical protein
MDYNKAKTELFISYLRNTDDRARIMVEFGWGFTPNDKQKDLFTIKEDQVDMMGLLYDGKPTGFAVGGDYSYEISFKGKHLGFVGGMAPMPSLFMALSKLPIDEIVEFLNA